MLVGYGGVWDIVESPGGRGDDQVQFANKTQTYAHIAQVMHSR